jgi:flagellar hook-length control protein FliK
MIGLTNEKTAMPIAVPETKTFADNLFARKETQNRESGRTNFENYLKAITDKSKPFRETGLDNADHQTMNRREERHPNKVMDSPTQTVKDDRGSEKKKTEQAVKDDKSYARDSLQDKPDNPGEISAKGPEQPGADDTASQNTDVDNTGMQALGVNPVIQTPVGEVVELCETLAGVQSIHGATGDELNQLQVSVTPGELLQNTSSDTATETVAVNPQNTVPGQTATAQTAVDALNAMTQASNTASQQTGANSGQGMTEAMEALLGAETSQKNTVSHPPQTKGSEDSGNGLKGTVLNATVLEVFQDKVTAQSANQNLYENKDQLQQSLQNGETAKTLVGGAGNKPVNLAVLQTQLAVGDGLDKTNNTMVMPLQQHQVAGGQFQEITGTTVQIAGKDQLFTQIMEHAKLMLSGNQSELEMNLKPEHLGKLQLKVLVENQVVTARFVAESQQVKQIIETNLNQLRDQLRESGLMVDNLSVSIGTGTNEQFFNQTAGNQGQSGDSQNSHVYSDGQTDFSMDGDAVSTPKSLQDTVIDLIA